MGDSTSNSPRLLLVDDDSKLTRLLSGYLTAQGFEVTVAHDGAEGLARARAEHWDLVVLDVMLPRIDGFEVLRLLRRFSAVPVLMLTGRGAEDDLVTGLEGGADDYLAKTASARELSTRIRALLRRALVRAGAEERARDMPRPALAVGALRLDPEMRVATLEGLPLELTGVEFDLLAELMKNRGRVRTREQLLHEVRERRFESFDRSIDVHISSLRKKLGDDSRASRYIRTVRGVGYSLLDAACEPPE